MHITAHKYSMVSKALQIAALIILFLLIASKAMAHVDLIDPTLSIDRVVTPERSKEVERQKEMDREMNPDLSDRERASRDRDLENGSLGAA